jgi:hypothetical protein
MGKILCPLHGDQGISLVCPHLRQSITAGLPLENYREFIFGGELLGSYKITHPLYGSCATNLGLTEADDSELDWEVWAERMELEPICGACYLEARK